MIKMRIRFKVILITGIFLVLLIVALYPITTYFMIGTYQDLEYDYTRKEMQLTSDELDQQVGFFHNNTKHFTSNDRTYEFALNKSYRDEFMETELKFEVFEKLQANFILILDGENETIFKKAYSLLFEYEDNWPMEIDDHIMNHDLHDFEDTRDETRGYLELNEDVYMISARPILTTGNEGPLAGTVIMGRLIDRNVIYSFPLRNDADLDIARFSDDYHPSDFEEVMDSGEFDRIHIKRLSSSEIAGYIIIKDLHEEPIFIYKVTVPRDITIEGYNVLISYFFLTAIALVLGMVVFALVAELVVINRLTNLSEDVLEITKNKDPDMRIKNKGRDEIFDLSTNINVMLDSIRSSQEMLKESEEKYRKLVLLSPMGIMITIDGRIDFINDSALAITRAPSKEYLVGEDILKMVPPDQLSSSNIIQEKLKKEGSMDRPVTVSFPTNEGILIEIDVMASKFMIKGKEAIIYLLQDVTDKNRMKHEIEDREQRYRTLFEMSTDAIFLAKDGIITDFNTASLELFECSHGDLIGISPMEISPEYQPNGERSQDLFLRNLSSLMKGDSLHFEWDHKTFEGNIIKTETSLRQIELKSEKFMFALVRDITERKEQEENLIEERNRASLYFDLLSHDIGNMHQGINSSLEMAILQERNREAMKKYLNQSRSLVEKSMRFVRYVKILSNPHQDECLALDLMDIIDSGTSRAVNSFPSVNIDISRSYDEERLMILSHPIIEEVVYNIVHNAIKFQNNSNYTRIEIDIIHKNGYILLKISDHGPGLSDERKTNMFDRYKSGGSLRFTGIGLSLVKDLMDKYSEGIEVLDRVAGDHTKGVSFLLKFKKAM